MNGMKHLFAALCASAALSAFGLIALTPATDHLSIAPGEDVFTAKGAQVEMSAYDVFEVESGSICSLTMAGLPSGVRYEAKSARIFGKPTKDGVYYVTCSGKNEFGYTSSAVLRWVVGNAADGDYDNIGLDDSVVEGLSGMRTGKSVSFCSNMKSISGLPSGVKFKSGSRCMPGGPCTECSGFVSGIPGKAGKFKLTIGDYSGNKAVKTVIVKDDGCAWFDALPGTMSLYRGVVTGSGVKKFGSSVKIAARPAKGYFFGGWYEDAECTMPFYYTASGGYQKASDSLTFDLDAPRCLYAKFVTQDEDYLNFDFDGTWNVETSYSSDYFFFDIWSETPVTLTAKGLPAGIKLLKSSSSYYLEAADVAKLKPGVYTVTLSGKTASGISGTKDVRVVVPNIESSVFKGLDYEPDAYSCVAGVDWEECVSFNFDEDYVVTASGLPQGLKLRTLSGYAWVTGATAKPGVYTVTLNAQKGRTEKKKATFTLTVEPMPASLVGTYYGTMKSKNGGEVNATFAFTVASSGKLSVKVVSKHGTFSASAPAWAYISNIGEFVACFEKETAKERFSLELYVPTDAEWNCDKRIDGVMSWYKEKGDEGTYVDSEVYAAQKNPFSKTGTAYDHPTAVSTAESLAKEYASTKVVLVRDWDFDGYRIECAGCVAMEEGSADYGEGTLKVNKNGTVTISGKMWNNQSFSASTTLSFYTACGGEATSASGECCRAIFAPVMLTPVCPECCTDKSCLFGTEKEAVPMLWDPFAE